jgi:hypothetical protein
MYSRLALALTVGALGCSKKEKDDTNTTETPTQVQGSGGDGSTTSTATVEAALTVTASVASVPVDGTIDVKVVATDTSAATEDVTVTSEDESIATAEVTSAGITVTGVSLGSTTITVTSASDLTSEIHVNVLSPSTLDIGGAELTFSTQFTYAWGDGGSGADDDGSYWNPVPPAGFYALGSYGTAGYADPSGVTAVPVLRAIGNSDALAAPTDYELIWGDWGSGADDDGSAWRPLAPTGYVCLGVVFASGYDKPSTDAIRCVREDLTAVGRIADYIWDDAGSGADSDFGSWRIAPPATAVSSLQYLPAGTFVGVASHDMPTGDALAHVLAYKPIIITAADDATVAPSLDSHDEPDAETSPLLSRVMALPFQLINDDQHDLAWKVANSPIYRLSRDVYYRVLLFQDNRNAATEASTSKSDTIGINETTSETYSHTWGISITATAGIEIDGLSAGISTTVSEEFGFSRTDSTTQLESHQVTKTLATPAGASGAMWQKVNRFQLLRREPDGDGGETWTSVGDPWDVPVDSYVTSQFPR